MAPQRVQLYVAAQLREAELPVRMLGDCPLVEHVEFRDCHVRIAVDCAAATTSSQRHKAFLDQFLEPLARYKSVVVENPHVVLVDMWAPPADAGSPAWGVLVLDLGTDETWAHCCFGQAASWGLPR